MAKRKCLPVIRNTGQGVVPSQEGGEESKVSTSLGEMLAGGRFICIEISKAQEKECQVQGEEQQEEGNGRSQCAEQEDSRENEPACEEEAECVRKVVCAGTSSRVSGGNVESTWSEDNGERYPETTI